MTNGNKRHEKGSEEERVESSNGSVDKMKERKKKVEFNALKPAKKKKKNSPREYCMSTCQVRTGASRDRASHSSQSDTLATPGR